ncbi:MAG: hypothetical protein U0T74_00980 [Chitinophagales bacterium]
MDNTTYCKPKFRTFKELKVISMFTMLILGWAFNSHAQNNVKIAGNYRLLHPKVTYKTLSENSDNYLFAQHYKSGKTISISKDGTFFYQVGDAMKSVRVEFISDYEIKLIFVSVGGSKNDERDSSSESYSVYNYNEDKHGFTIFREDPLLKEVYTFVRTQ